MAELGAQEVAKPRCNIELAKGLLISERLRQLLKGQVRIERASRTLAEVLIREGLAIPYKPGPEAFRQRAAH